MATNKGKDYKTDAKLMVLYVLMKYSDEDHFLSRDEILAKVNAEYSYQGSIEKSTLDRSLDAVKAFLEEKSDIFGKFKNGTEKNAERRVNIRIEHLFRNHELRYLIDMVSSCDYIKVKDRQALIEKLLLLSSDRFLSDYRPHLYKKAIKQEMRTDFFKNLYAIHQAIVQKKQIRFYRVQREPDGYLSIEEDETGDFRSYIVNPYRTISIDGFYYLVCSRVPEDGSEPSRLSNYRVDRMDGVVVLQNTRVFSETSIAGVPKNIDTLKYISTHRMMWGGTPEKVRFRCPQWAMNEIVDYFGDTYRICEEEKAGNDSEPLLIVRVESTLENMRIWARRFFDFIEILSPDPLRQMLKKDLADAYEKYSRDI